MGGVDSVERKYAFLSEAAYNAFRAVRELAEKISGIEDILYACEDSGFDSDVCGASIDAAIHKLKSSGSTVAEIVKYIVEDLCEYCSGLSDGCSRSDIVVAELVLELVVSLVLIAYALGSGVPRDVIEEARECIGRCRYKCSSGGGDSSGA